MNQASAQVSKKGGRRTLVLTPFSFFHSFSLFLHPQLQKKTQIVFLFQCKNIFILFAKVKREIIRKKLLEAKGIKYIKVGWKIRVK